jgi:hypothetical protein
MEKKFLIGMAVLLSASLFFLGCGGGDDDDTGDGTQSGDALVTNRDLTGLVAKPATGAAAAGAIEGVAEYTGDVTWSGGQLDEGKFLPGTVYTATVALKATEGNTFDKAGANAFTHDDAKSVTNDAPSGKDVTVTILFRITLADAEGTPNALPAAAYRLSAAQVVQPKNGEGPQAAFAATDYYTGTISWKDSKGAALTGSFGPNEAYTATVILAATPEYTLAGTVAGAFAYDGTDGAAVTSAAVAADGTVTVAIGFPPTAGEGENLTPVYSRNLANAIVAPATGATPVYVFTSPDSAQYGGGEVAWDPEIAEGGTFAEGVYVAKVTLTAKDGYTLAGLAANAFSYAGATGITFNAADGLVTVTFDKTDAVVTALDLAGAIAAPVTGATPVLVFTNPDPAQYKGGAVTWSPPVDIAAEETFAAGQVYKAAVTLTPEKGYTFATLKEDAFGAGTKYAAATGILEVEFAATAAVVTETNLATWIATPVKNAVPPPGFSAPQYDGAVVWTWMDGEKETALAAGTPFAAARAYTAKVTLTPKEGLFTFTGFAGAFTHSGGTPGATTPKDGKAEVAVAFGATKENETSTAYDTDPIRVTPSKGTLDSISLTKTKTGPSTDTVVLTLSNSVGASMPGGSINWYLDGSTTALTPGQGGLAANELTLTLDPKNYNSRDHHVTVTLTINTAVYSVTVPFTVLPAAE